MGSHHVEGFYSDNIDAEVNPLRDTLLSLQPIMEHNSAGFYNLADGKFQLNYILDDIAPLETLSDIELVQKFIDNP